MFVDIKCRTCFYSSQGSGEKCQYEVLRVDIDAMDTNR